MTDRLRGKTALITAAAQGIGRATALAFAREGAAVIATDVNEAALGGLAATPGIETRRLDVTDDAAVAALAAAVPAPHVLVNCAGFVHHGTILECRPEDWEFSMRLNVRAMYVVTRAVLPRMVAGGGGAIVNIASVSAFRGSVERPSHAYAASKGAVLSLTRAMAASYGLDGIRVNAICPGTIRTRLTADIVERVERTAKEGRGIPVRRVGEPEDIARCALFLASDDASFVSGAHLVVDGGALTVSV